MLWRPLMNFVMLILPLYIMFCEESSFTEYLLMSSGEEHH